MACEYVSKAFCSNSSTGEEGLPGGVRDLGRRTGDFGTTDGMLGAWTSDNGSSVTVDSTVGAAWPVDSSLSLRVVGDRIVLASMSTQTNEIS